MVSSTSARIERGDAETTRRVRWSPCTSRFARIKDSGKRRRRPGGSPWGLPCGDGIDRR